MTFYWWSHWFWITAMSNLLIFHLIVVVHTYPSQDSSQEFNRHQTENTKKLVTKLYQTSTISWSTEPSMAARTTAVEKTLLQSVTKSEETLSSSSSTTPPPTPPPLLQSSSSTYKGITDKHLIEHDGFEEYYYDEEDETPTKQIGLVEMEEDIESKSVGLRSAFVPDENENDIKRSAEHFSKSTESEMKQIMDLSPKELSSSTSSSAAAVTPLEDKNNYTNFTDKHFSSTNATARNMNVMNTTPTTTSSSPKISDKNSDTLMAASSASSVIAFESSGSSEPVVSMLTNNSNNNVTLSPHAPPATPKIVGAQHHGTLDWLNRMADVAVSPPTAGATTTDTNDERFPFTLENAHKTEDLRRDESEPRTRKSKGLSAEYKHGYASINYSSETKNLLTRSASTTVNEYEIEESNISSEALSVQRAYFMDVGAISAICFTVFGICCTVGTIGIVLYRRRYLNKPQALSEPDSSVYIDDSTMRVSDNSDEMYSLDNDSFLNSLEAMTIQNYWTDTVKHTKL